jgi:hypothetical protein
MSVKKVCLATLVTALLGLGSVRGQYATPGQYSPTTPGAVGGMTAPPANPSVLANRPFEGMPTNDQSQQPAPGQPVSLCLSDWIIGGKGSGCCGPVGGNGPVQMEIYLQSGVTIPFSDGVFGHTLQTGWEIQGGGRSLFFNTEETAAWVIDLSLSNLNNHGRNPSYEVPLTHILVPTATAPQVANQAAFAFVNFVPQAAFNKLAKEKHTPAGSTTVTLTPARGAEPELVAAPGVTISDLNRTFFNLGGGRDWYLLGRPAPTYLNCADRGCEGGGPVWRFGIDGGGRYGTAKLELHELRHRTDTIAGLYIGAHTDVEVPCGCCIFQAGIRFEYDYTWMDILQERNDADVSDINLLLTVGTRF